MAIVMISGALGTGKTALAVKLLMESEFYPGSAFVYGVRGWKGAGTYRELRTQEHAKENQKLLEDTGRVTHSCYLVDEAKKVWPSRVAGRDAPPFIDQHLAESRSVSQDWILTCQAPTQIDVALRRLITRHIHLERTALGIRYSEAGSVRDDLKFERDESRKYDFPVESLKFYDSDEGVTTHQKKGLKLPKRLIFLLLLIAAMGGIIAYFWNTSPMFGGAAAAGEEKPSMLGQAFNPSYGVPGQKADVLPMTAAPNKFYYLPRNPEYPELARNSRLPVSCVASAAKCLCYDQAAQLIEDMGESRCRAIIAGKNNLATLYPKPPPVLHPPSSEGKTFRTPAPRQGSEATAPKGLEPRPTGPEPRIPSPPPAGEALT